MDYYEFNSKEMDLWIQNMESECSEMRNFLRDHASDSAIYDELKEQLTWLRFQIHHYQQSGNIENLTDDFNWVVSNFNRKLHIPESKQFAYFPNKN